MCTNMIIKATNNDLFFGRTMDLDIPMFKEDEGFQAPVQIINIPSGVTYMSQIDKWKTKYAVIGVGLKDSLCIFDGINEEGLVGDCQVLKEMTRMKLDDVEKSELFPCLGEEFVSYILTNYKTVSEIKYNIDNLCILDMPYIYNEENQQYPLHYSFIDLAGQGIVLEPVNNGRFKVYDYVGVMTNSPEYDYHTINIRNYIGLRNTSVKANKYLHTRNEILPIEGGTGYGLFGLPGDYTSPSRFVRAFFIRDMIDSFDRENGIQQLYAAFHPLIIPRGLEHKDFETEISDYTRYWSGYDIAQKILYIQPDISLTITSKKLDKSLKTIACDEISTSSSINLIK